MTQARFAIEEGVTSWSSHHTAKTGSCRSDVEFKADPFYLQTWRVSTLGTYLCYREVVEEMRRRRGGVILFTGATSSIRGRNGVIDTHAVHERLKPKPGEPLLDPKAIAETFWALTLQEPSAWTFELELRPSTEEFFT